MRGMTTMYSKIPMGRIAALGVLALALAPVAPATGALEAQDRIQERHELRPDASVDISVVSHQVRVERWNRSEIEVTGTYDADREELEVRAQPGSFRLQIRVRNGRGWTRRGSADLVVRVPEGVRLDVATVSGSTRVVDLGGEVGVRSVSGSATVEGSPRSLAMETVSGSIAFRGASETVRASTVSGSVQLEGEVISARANSVSGQVRVTSSVPVDRAEFNVVSGSVRFEGPVASTGILRVESHSGQVDLFLVGPVNARFDLSTFSGRLEHSLEGVQDERHHRPRWGPGEELTFTVGAGDARIEANSFSGSVRIREIRR